MNATRLPRLVRRVDYARAHGHDLIVVGHRGRFLGDCLLGSAADRVAHHARCPVMVVR